MNRWLSYLVILLMIYAFCLALSNIVVGTLFLDESTCASSNQTQKLIPIGLMVDGIVMLFYLPIKFLYNFDTFMSQGLDPKDFYTENCEDALQAQIRKSVYLPICNSIVDFFFIFRLSWTITLTVYISRCWSIEPQILRILLMQTIVSAYIVYIFRLMREVVLPNITQHEHLQYNPSSP